MKYFSRKNVGYSRLFFILLIFEKVYSAVNYRGLRYAAALEQEFYDWIADNFREVTAQPSTDPDFFNHLRISSKDGMYHKGKILKAEDMEIIRSAENIVIVCDKRNTHPIVMPPLLLEVATVKSLFLKNIVVPSHTSITTRMEILEEIELHSCTIYDLTTLVPINSGLKKLILHDCDIRNCWLEAAKVPLLETLIINNSNLHSINKEVFMLPNLKKIDLRNNQILFLPVFNTTDIPLTNELLLKRNRLSEYPRQLNQFKRLKIVDLSFNFIEKFDVNFVRDLALISLNLEGNAIKELPEGIDNLLELKELNLSYNNLEECKIEVFQLPELEKLNLSFNKFRKLDETISMLSRGIFDASGLAPGDAPYKLKELDLSYNFLVDIPLSFKCFQSLQILNLDGNLIQKVPDAVLNLINLEILKMSFNRLRFIPTELSRLPFLIEVFLKGGIDFRTTVGTTNQITLIPKQLLNQKSGRIVKLYLRNNPIFFDSTFTAFGLRDINTFYNSHIVL